MSDDTISTARTPAADAKDSQKKPAPGSPARPRFDVLLELSATVNRQLLLRGGGRTAAWLRELVVAAVGKAVADGLPTRDACTAVGICERTYQRWHKLQQEGQNFDHRSCTAHPPSRAGLRELRLEVLKDPRFEGMSAYQVVMTLYDEGLYIGSVSTVYREMRKMREEARAARRKPRPGDDWCNAVYPSGSNQLWSMDFTLLPRYGGGGFRLCVVMDVYDRYAIAARVAECLPDTGADIASSATLARTALSTSMRAEFGREAADTLLMLRTDCSSAWQHPNFLAALAGTSVHHTCSRHLHPTDNAHSERLWKTLMSYGLPRHGFSSLQAAQRWAVHALRRYNEEHHHSALMGLTPLQYRRGEQGVILSRRRQVRAASPHGTSQEEQSAHAGKALKGCRPRPGRLRKCAETAESSGRRLHKLQRLREQRRARRRDGGPAHGRGCWTPGTGDGGGVRAVRGQAQAACTARQAAPPAGAAHGRAQTQRGSPEACRQHPGPALRSDATPPRPGSRALCAAAAAAAAGTPGPGCAWPTGTAARPGPDPHDPAVSAPVLGSRSG